MSSLNDFMIFFTITSIIFGLACFYMAYLFGGKEDDLFAKKIIVVGCVTVGMYYFLAAYLIFNAS